MKTLALNWLRIGLSVVIPTLIGFAVARVLWRREDTMMGNVVAAGAVFTVILLFFAGEYIEITKFQIACAEAVTPCRLRLGAFNRYVIYGFAGFVDVAIIFAAGLRFEERSKRAAA